MRSPVREIAARTEQYWCPIKHAIRVRASHERYRRFLEYGDARAYRDELAELRRELSELGELESGRSATGSA